ncbi:hypothetical protein BJ165DRAFT_1401356 [Panaeolus papilionaceus]|nr:hypothetical protein BJ165DRAFT_1401356 [Panaeolus papilionaceus]
MLISDKESPQRTVLGNLYLLTEIFEFLQDTPPALCAAALTCRAFRKPAQDVVWRWMDFDLLPVIQLIGNVVFVLSGLDVGVGCWFPHLRTLHLELRPPFFTIIMHLLQSLQLISVEIPGSCALIDGLVPLICDILTFVQNIAPSDMLKRLNLATSPNPETLATIPKFRNLRSLQLNMSMGSTVPHVFLPEISQLEYLEELNFDGGSFGFTLQQRNAGLEFPVLTKFLVSSLLEDLAKLFSLAKFPFLLPQELPQSHGYDWLQFLDALYGATSTDRFKELYTLPCPDLPYNACPLIEAFTHSYHSLSFHAITPSLLQFKLMVLSHGLETLSVRFFGLNKRDVRRVMEMEIVMDALDDDDDDDAGGGPGTGGPGPGPVGGAGAVPGAGGVPGGGRGGPGEAVWNAIKGLQSSRLVERRREGLVEDEMEKEKGKGKDREGMGWEIDMQALEREEEDEGGEGKEGK